MEQPKDLDFNDLLRRRWAVVAVLTVLAASVGFGVSLTMSPVYQASASMLVGDFGNGDVSNNEIQAMQSQAATYADVARREPVLLGVAQDVGSRTDWADLLKSVDIHVPNESPQVIEITVDGPSRQWTIDVAGAIVKRLMRYVDQSSGAGDFVSPQLAELEKSINDGENRIDELKSRRQELGTESPTSLDAEIRRLQEEVTSWRGNYASFKQLATDSSPVGIRPLDHPHASQHPVSPDTRFNTLIAGVAGLLLGLALVYLLESRGGWRRSDPDQEPRTELPLILPHGSSRATVPVNGRNGRRDPSRRVAGNREGEVR